MVELVTTGEERKMNKLSTKIVGLIMALALLGSCRPLSSETTSEVTQTTSVATGQAALPFTVNDALGREVTFDRLPQRIVIAGKASSLILDAFYMFPEALTRIVAYENRSQNGTNFLQSLDPNAAEKQALQQDAGVEQILPYQPDLVVLKYYLKDQLGDALEAVGVKVFYMNMETPEKFLNEVGSIGEILGDPQRSAEILTQYQKMENSVDLAVSSVGAEQKPGVLVVQYSDKGGSISFTVPPQSWIQTTLVELAGGEPVWLDAAQESGWTQVNLEQIAAWDPDYIFVIYYAGDSAEVVQQLLQDPTWQSLQAYRQGQRIYGFPSDFMSWDQPDTRWILGLTYLAYRLQPDKITSQMLSDSLYAFYEKLYSYTQDEVKLQVLPILKGDFPK
jgi:iron complex transport system substrate-binding protein